MEILIYAVIAAILVYRLYSILGQRDGNERGRPSWRAGNPFAPRPDHRTDDQPDNRTDPRPPQKPHDNKDDLLSLPLPAAREDMGRDASRLMSVEPAQDSLAGALFAIQRADTQFDERSFLRGARIAFEMIVRAFTGGDRITLKNLLTPKLYNAFEQAIASRELSGERWEMKTITVQDMDIIAAKLEGSVATITVQCVSDQSKCVYDKNGSLIKDPGREVERLTDVWVFRRDVKSGNPNWQLVETRSL